MKPYDYRPFDDTLIDAAAQLLAARHQRDCVQFPQLSQRFATVDVARQAIAAQWQRPWSSGVAAFAGNELIGYLIGYMQVDQFFGRAIWSRLAGHALAPEIDPDLYRDLYAAAAPQWLQWGCFEHLALVPATADYLEPWSMLSFGRMHAYGVLSLDTISTDAAPLPPQVTIRRAQQGDEEHLRAMAYITAGHQLNAPTWALTPPESMADRPAQYAGIVADDEVTCWLAFVGDEPASFQAWYPAEEEADLLDVPEQAFELAAAGTLPEWRGRGVTRALIHHALAHAKAEGYRYAITNWRTTNLLSSRTWPALGFTPVMYRLHRHVDERILWGTVGGRSVGR